MLYNTNHNGGRTVDFQDMSGNVPALGPADTTEPVGGVTHMPEASDVVANRAGRYGHPSNNLQTIADLWTVLLDRLAGAPRGSEQYVYRFSADDVALFMVLVKLAREANGHEADNLLDIEGYALCARMIRGEVGE